MGGNLDWLATWLSSIRELEQRIKRLGGGGEGLGMRARSHEGETL